MINRKTKEQIGEGSECRVFSLVDNDEWVLKRYGGDGSGYRAFLRSDELACMGIGAPVKDYNELDDSFLQRKCETISYMDTTKTMLEHMKELFSIAYGSQVDNHVGNFGLLNGELVIIDTGDATSQSGNVAVVNG